MVVSESAMEILRAGVGYRCESYGGSRVRSAFEVLDFEVLELDNTDMLNEAEKALGLPETEGVEDVPEESLRRLESVISKRFGKDAVAIWLATRKEVQRYCERGEAVDKYKISKGALLISDLGPDGQLFLMTKSDFIKSDGGG